MSWRREPVGGDRCGCLIADPLARSPRLLARLPDRGATRLPEALPPSRLTAVQTAGFTPLLLGDCDAGVPTPGTTTRSPRCRRWPTGSAALPRVLEHEPDHLRRIGEPARAVAGVPAQTQAVRRLHRHRRWFVNDLGSAHRGAAWQRGPGLHQPPTRKSSLRSGQEPYPDGPRSARRRPIARYWPAGRSRIVSMRIGPPVPRRSCSRPPAVSLRRIRRWRSQSRRAERS